MSDSLRESGKSAAEENWFPPPQKKNIRKPHKMQWKFHFSYRGLFAVHDFFRVSQYSCHSICSHSQVEVHLLALSGVSQIINSFAVLSWQKNYLPVPHSKLVNYPWRNKKFQNELSTGFQLPKRDDVFPLERCENFSERNFCERMEQMISPEKKVIVPHTFKSKSAFTKRTGTNSYLCARSVDSAKAIRMTESQGLKRIDACHVFFVVPKLRPKHVIPSP